MQSANPVAIVTGANRGIGLELSRQLAQRGFVTIMGSRNRDRGEAAAAQLRAEGLEVHPYQLDVADPVSVADCAKRVVTDHGCLDVLVNNAAVDYDSDERARDANLERVSEALTTNLIGAWRMASACIPLLCQSRHGRLVNVSSEAGSLQGMTDGPPAYSVTKVALNALTRLLAAELRGDGVLVNAVSPGWVSTDMGGEGGRPVADGAASVLWAVLLDDSGPTGGFFRDGKPVPW